MARCTLHSTPEKWTNVLPAESVEKLFQPGIESPKRLVQAEWAELLDLCCAALHRVLHEIVVLQLDGRSAFTPIAFAGGQASIGHPKPLCVLLGYIAV